MNYVRHSHKAEIYLNIVEIISGGFKAEAVVEELRKSGMRASMDT